jgi:phosphomannomutase
MKKELKNLNANVIDGDIMPTPTVLFSVRKHMYDGAIIITASHNPIEYNGLKFINKKALFCTGEEIETIEKYYKEELEGKNISSDSLEKNSGEQAAVPNFTKEHADEILAHVDVEAIRAKKFKVAVDMINASACVMDPYLFEKLGVEFIPLNNIPNGKFAHKPEPIGDNLGEIMKITEKLKPDLGFVHDPDADRLVLINEKGEIVFEEYTIVLAIENILSKNPGKTIAINLSTSRMSVDVAKKYGSECILAEVGEPNVVKEIISHNAIIGGEGNGGVIYPTINLARDSFVGIALILELLAERGKTISECIALLPKYFMKKDKLSIIGLNLQEIILKLKTHFKEAKTIEIDGIRLDFPDNSWLHLHPSNTEPIVRLYGEAKTQERIDALFNEAKLTSGLK